ncbi:MAG: type II secretion system F family protein [Acetivibrionales bacterium]
MILVFAAFAAVMAAIWTVSSGRYADIVKLADKRSYPLRFMLPVGLYLLDLFKYGFNTGYDRKLIASITELHGHKEAITLLRIYMGNKIAMMLMSLLFALFIGTIAKPDAGYLVFTISLPVGIAVFTDRDLFEKVKKRRLAIQMDFPDFVNKLTLLINAGMTVSKAWERIARDGGKNTPLYRELNIAVNAVRSGVPEHKAYEEFAKRCHVPVVTRFITVILQNIRKGNSELVPILRVYANECWELRKTTAKRLGEEASTKMLLPMTLMFIAILLIVGMPAVLALRNI